MAKQDERFIKVLNEGSTWTTNREIWVDKTTGVNYLWIASGNAGGLTPLLDADGGVLALVEDDSVQAWRPGAEAEVVAWREVEVELVGRSPAARGALPAIVEAFERFKNGVQSVLHTEDSVPALAGAGIADS